MIHIEENVSLRDYNTFGIQAYARYFCSITSEHDLLALMRQEVFKRNMHLILGGGSNLLFTKDFDGLVIKVNLKGIDLTEQSEDRVTLHVMSGEVWHEFVLHCVHHGYGGIENLSLIPGTVGAAPIQNIGAYGVEVKEVIERVHGIDLLTGEQKSFTNEQCQFGYRESIFKHTLKEKFFISSVTLTLTRINHRFNVQYGALADTLNAMNQSPSLQSISDAVIQIRKSKLPDPSVIGNAGSFFKNPTISKAHYELLQKEHSKIPGYPSVNQEVKVPAGWLIEQCGWKGKRFQHVGVHAHQALVLVNYGGGTGDEIFQLAMRISESVQEKFNITLTPEVNIIGK